MKTASERSGRFVPITGGANGYAAHHPAALPVTPAIVLTPALQRLLDLANQELGRLDGITALLPDPQTLLYTYVRKEAVHSSQIEGTQSSLSDLLLFENEAAPGVPISDVAETANYITAMNTASRRCARADCPCRRDCCARRRGCCSKASAERTRPQVSSAATKIGTFCGFRGSGGE